MSNFFSIFAGFISMISANFLEKILAQFCNFCSGNFAGRAPSHSGNFDVRYLTCSRRCIASNRALKPTCLHWSMALPRDQ